MLYALVGMRNILLLDKKIVRTKWTTLSISLDIITHNLQTNFKKLLTEIIRSLKLKENFKKLLTCRIIRSPHKTNLKG